ncbi:MAG: EamA family transporter [Cyanobacteria bacterium J06626_18]
MLALTLDTPKTLIQALATINGISLFAVVYLAFGATLFGFGIWSKLLSKYPAGRVAPLSLLVPVTGLLTASFVLGERLSWLQWLGCLVVMLGLIISSSLFARRDVVRPRE